MALGLRAKTQGHILPTARNIHKELTQSTARIVILGLTSLLTHTEVSPESGLATSTRDTLKSRLVW